MGGATFGSAAAGARSGAKIKGAKAAKAAQNHKRQMSAAARK
jgi:hypothetical protein